MHEWWDPNHTNILLAALRRLHRGQRVYIVHSAAGVRLLSIAAVLLILTACGAPAAPAPRWAAPGDITAALQAAGLEAIDPAPMTPDDYGPAPFVAEGVHFLIPSLCPDCGGRAFVGSQEEISQLRAYYDSLAQSSALFFSWVFVSPDGRALIQLNGDLQEDIASRYASVLAGDAP